MTRRPIRNIAMTLVCIAPILSGCVGLWVAGGTAAVGGATAYAYTRGTYKAVLQASMFEADRAIRTIAERAKLIELKRICNGYQSHYKYQDIHDNKVAFKLKAITPETTRIYIRVGRCGDRETSQELLQAIDRELQTPGA